MKTKDITLLSIDKITKKQVLTNRKVFKHRLNAFRVFINASRKAILANPFVNEWLLSNEILDDLDAICKDYTLNDNVVSKLLGISPAYFSKLRSDVGRNKNKPTPRSTLRERIEALTLLKMGKTPKEVAELYGVTKEAVYYWQKCDREFGISMDKAVAFRHSKEV